MKGEHEFLKARFAYVRQDLEAVLRRLQDSDLTWSPREGMHTIAELLLEIANKEKEALGWIQTGVWPDDGPDAFDVATATLEDIKAAMASLRATTYAYIDSLSEAQLDALVHSPEGWWEALRLNDCPVRWTQLLPVINVRREMA